MSGAASRNRGLTTERDFVRYARAHGFDGAERTVVTGHRSGERVRDDGGDVDLAPGVVVSVKSLRPVSRAERAVPGWLAEAEQQRQACGAAVVLLVVRREGTADVGGWFAWLPLYVLHNLAWPEHLHPWTELDHRPVRLSVADALLLMRTAGYGDPLADVGGGSGT